MFQLKGLGLEKLFPNPAQFGLLTNLEQKRFLTSEKFSSPASSTYRVECAAGGKVKTSAGGEPAAQHPMQLLLQPMNPEAGCWRFHTWALIVFHFVKCY